jgi:hypothetical protein
VTSTPVRRSARAAAGSVVGAADVDAVDTVGDAGSADDVGSGDGVDDVDGVDAL